MSVSFYDLFEEKKIEKCDFFGNIRSALCVGLLEEEAIRNVYFQSFQRFSIKFIIISFVRDRRLFLLYFIYIEVEPF